MTLAARRVLVVVLLLTATLGVLAAPGAAADYYNGTSNDQEFQEDRNEWLADVDLTLAGLVTLVGRIGVWLIGVGVAAPSGASAGALVTGVLLGGTMLGFVAPARVGSVAGGVLGVSGLAAIVAVDAAPTWLYAVALFAVGLLTATVFRSALR
jgi:hypothetical protein